MRIVAKHVECIVDARAVRILRRLTRVVGSRRESTRTGPETEEQESGDAGQRDSPPGP
ncbi:MAG: hypothetical protein QOG65_3461, partial [Actinomycetota bacterium]|nr:hypothetical protein [Actinomycetota bacterium]